MAYILSQPAETLLGSGTSSIDTLIVGSGYGAAMAAFCLSEPGSQVAPDQIWVMERGKEYQPGEFPKTAAELPGHVMGTGTEVRFGERDGLFDLKLGDGVSALVGSGLGGTSLINGGVAIDPSAEAVNRWPAHPDGTPWTEALRASADTVKRLLGVTTASGKRNHHPHAEQLAKFKALGGVAAGLKRAMRHTDEIESVEGPTPIPLAITFDPGPNAVGINQHACIDCGNCITGCNIGAKNTLAMNVWPLVESRGVRLFTGGSVLRLRRPGDYWAVDLVLTRNAGDLEVEGAPRTSFSIHARQVILAAGTFGSTEILKRSEPDLTFSHRLGQRFSVNGDMMVLGLRRRQAVEAVASAPSTLQDTEPCRVGPLTASEVRVRVRRPGGRPHEVSIQDGAVPFPLRRIFGELLTTEHLARRFVDGHLPEQTSPAEDPLAVSPDLVSHSQLITAMGWEATSGSLEMRTLRHAPGLPGEPVLSPTWDAAAESGDPGYFSDLERVMEHSEQHGGFDGGHVLPCPPWRLVPRGLEVLEGFNRLDRHLVTTHPLGGCCMATDASDGVVDTRGRVFSATSGHATHPGLYVMDGAIIPGPIGVNPLMTIALLAHHLASSLAGVTAAAMNGRNWNIERKVIPAGHGFPVDDPKDETVGGILHERLFLDEPAPDDPGAATASDLRRQLGLGENQRLVIDIQTHCRDLYRWLEQPGEQLPATFQLSWSPARGDTVPDALVHPLGEPCPGQVILGGRLRAGMLVRLCRRLRAVAHFYRMRGDEIRRRVKDFLTFRTSHQPGGLLRFLAVSWQQAKVQAEWRYMRYAFNGDVTVDGRSRTIRFLGQKTLAYAGGYLDPLNALRGLPFSLDGTAPKPRHSPHLRVDMIRFTRDLAPFQVEQSPNSPTTMLALASAALFFLRGIIQTHFWSFGAPSYDAYADKATENRPRAMPPPRRLDYRHKRVRHQATLFELPNPPRNGMRLVRYTPPHQPHPQPVLLIHGLGHGSRVFWTDTTPVSMTQHLLADGFEVWLLDHRLSCNLGQDPSPGLSMEDIARVDIPWAVKCVYDAVNAGQDGDQPRQVKVFAHCIGAGAFAISALSGYLQSPAGTGKSMIDSAVIHAVSPWLVASEDNRWRANAISLFRSYFDDLAYEPIPHRDPSLAETLADRFASSFGWADEELELHASQRHERRPHFARTICNRMTLFYGDEWVHGNLDERTHLNLDTLVGPAPIEVLRQVYYCIVKGRLTNREGTNAYVRDHAIRAHWTFPTLFLHGSQNKVFNPDGSRTSALKLRKVLALPDGDPRVSLRIFRGYGHMDMLFGKEAHDRVFPSVSEFLDHHKLPDADPRHVDVETRPREQVRPPLGPATGPIVSRPRAEGGRRLVTVWSEVSQYTSRDAVVEYHHDGKLLDPSPVPATAPPSPGANGAASADRLPAADVRLCTLDVTDVEGPIAVSLQYQGDRDLESEPVAMLDWTRLPWFQRLREGAGPRDEVSFLVGSCLYPGAPAEQALSDRVFERMRPFVEGKEGRGIDHLLLVGDQIYADATADLFDPTAPLERFRERYRRAFGGPLRRVGENAHWILSHVPTYFAVDDHEISDNWPRDRLRRRHPRGERYGPEKELDFARGEAFSFMMHQPVRDGRLWYPFESAGHRFFVFDTRTQREPGPRSEVDTLINRAQQHDFARWVDETSNDAGRVIIVTGSPLGPISASHQRHPALCSQSDTLLGYPGFLDWLHGTLKRCGIHELIWISGDAHLSCLGSYTLRIDGHDDLAIRHVVASGLFAPLPFANHAWERFGGLVDLALDGPFNGTRKRLEITGEQRLLSSSSSHFVLVSVSGGGLRAQAHSAEEMPASDASACHLN